MPIPGKLEITLKINTMPTEVETTKHGWKEFVVDANGQMITITVRPKTWNKLVTANEQYPSWVAAIAGTMGKRTKDGFALETPAIQAFEKKPKQPKEPTQHLSPELVSGHDNPGTTDEQYKKESRL